MFSTIENQLFRKYGVKQTKRKLVARRMIEIYDKHNNNDDEYYALNFVQQVATGYLYNISTK